MDPPDWSPPEDDECIPGDICPPGDDIRSPPDGGFLAPDEDEEPPDITPPPVVPLPEGVCALPIEIRPAAIPSIVNVANVNFVNDIVISRVCEVD